MKALFIPRLAFALAAAASLPPSAFATKVKGCDEMSAVNIFKNISEKENKISSAMDQSTSEASTFVTACKNYVNGQDGQTQELNHLNSILSHLEASKKFDEQVTQGVDDLAGDYQKLWGAAQSLGLSECLRGLQDRFNVVKSSIRKQKGARDRNIVSCKLH